MHASPLFLLFAAFPDNDSDWGSEKAENFPDLIFQITLVGKMKQFCRIYKADKCGRLDVYKRQKVEGEKSFSIFFEFILWKQKCGRV